MIVVESGVGDLCEEKVNGIGIVDEDVDWFMFVIYVTNFECCINSHLFYIEDVL